MSVSAISLIQQGLTRLGYDPGPVDGRYGPRTETAAKEWVEAKGQAVGQTLPPATLAQIFQGQARYPVTEIALHCAATPPHWLEAEGLVAQRAEIRRWHMQERGWREIGYHWVVGRAGDVLAGRAETEIGAGIEGHNRGVIHICLIGGHGASADDPFLRHFTGRQEISLRQLIQGIAMRTAITRVSGHNEYAAKACPGFHVPNWLKEPQNVV